MGSMQTNPHSSGRFNTLPPMGVGMQHAARSFNTPNHDISCVIPPVNGIGGLYVGGYYAASDTQLLQHLGIKAVLTSAVEANLHYDRSIVPYHYVINAQDTPGFNLTEYFDQAVVFIRRCLRTTSVLVHCMAGISRSVTLVCAYLMADKGMSVDEAINFVRQHRRQVNPNVGFYGQLQQYQLVLNNRRTASNYATTPRSNIGSQNNLLTSTSNRLYNPGSSSSIPFQN